MSTIRIAASTLNTTPLDWKGNSQKIIEAIRQAKTLGAQILCLPELCISGYGCEDMFLSPDVCLQSKDILLNKILPETEDIFVCVGLPTLYKGAVYNTVASLHNGEIHGLHPKSHLAGDGIHYEPRWFKAWTHGKVDYTEQNIPIGDLIIQAGDIRLGYEICEDAWVAERPGHRLATEGIDIILNPSASHFAFGKIETRKRFVIEGSRAFHCAYVYSNLVGNEAGRAIYDGGAMIAATGELLVQGNRFSQKEFELICCDLNLSILRSRQAASSSRYVKEGQTPGLICIAPLTATKQTKPIPPIIQDEWEKSSQIKEEEFTRSIALALRDYKAKSQTQGFVVSLSGGADSAAVCALIYYMAALETPTPVSLKDILTTVYQASEQSSQTTRDAAQAVADQIGATHHTIDISALIKGYTQLYEKSCKAALTWQKNDITLQNIQARARGPFAWMLANAENKLLLSTSNRSEAAVGYATMDGDTCGALSPIAGIDKTFLRTWLQWVEKKGPIGLGNLSALHYINVQAPTAELRPQTEGKPQTDEEDLMPYPILGEIENLLIRDKLSPEETLEILCGKFPNYERPRLAKWLNKFQKLWKRNQWKRERYAPAFHVDDKNLDPRSWCRYPLLSGEPTEVE